MKRVLAALGVLAACGCLPVVERKVIVVDGEGVVMATPELFSLSARLSALGAAKSDALSEVSKTLAQILETMPALEGLETLKVDSSSALIRPIYESACLERAQYRQEQACPIQGYVGEITLNVVGSPASVSGNALSLLVELGAAETELSGFALVDPEAAKAEAVAAAMSDARAKAAKLAEAANANIGPLARVQYGEGFSEEHPYDRDRQMAVYSPQDRIVVTGSRIAPKVALVLSPQPFEIREKITAAFAIE